MEVVGSINTIMLLRICEYPNIETKEDFTLNIFVVWAFVIILYSVYFFDIIIILIIIISVLFLYILFHFYNQIESI